MYDARAVQTKKLGAADSKGVGLTTDSGIDQRKRNFFHSQVESTLPAENDDFTILKIRVQWPLIGGVFSPFCQNRYKLAGDAIFQDLPYAVPNLNQVQVTILMDDIKKNGEDHKFLDFTAIPIGFPLEEAVAFSLGIPTVGAA